MAWRANSMEEQRKLFIEKYLENQELIIDLCDEFDISRTTAYKWINRFRLEGYIGLKDKSKAPHYQAYKISEEVEKLILQIKKQYSKWGSKKILIHLQDKYPCIKCPSRTTIHNILEKNDLVSKRKFRKRFPAKTDPLSHCQNPNDVWCIDFKGWSKTKDNIKFDPLTLTDAYSRYLLYCAKQPANTVEYVWDVLQNLFKEYGLPIYLRHDNGPPFATSGTGRLSRLSVNLIKAGVIPEWITPGKPHENGRHERMHLTMKQEAIFPSHLIYEEQHIKLQKFREYYNFERPHEGIGQEIPGNLYVPSERKWNGKLEEPQYSEEFQVKRVRDKGQLSWYGTDIYIGKTLRNEFIGIQENEFGDWSVYFGPVYLGVITVDKEFIVPTVKPKRKSKYQQRIF